jgi:hypothetical protein
MDPNETAPPCGTASTAENLQKGAEDFRYLLNRGYPRKAALELVGNRYGLALEPRDLLHRGVFSNVDAVNRHRKKVSLDALRGQDLAVDGHNVVITTQAGFSGHPLVLGDDGFIRDISRLSGAFRPSAETDAVLEAIVDALGAVRPSSIHFLFDGPISGSGELAAEVRDRLRRTGLSGDALAVKVPETVLLGFPGVVATSDTVILDRASRAVDLAGEILRRKTLLTSLVRWHRP